MSAGDRFIPGKRDAITDVAGIRVGHWTARRVGTGCTVIRCEESTFAAVDARGGGPGTRETDVLDAANVVRRCHAIVFAGGSAFGLGAADGAMRWLREHDTGFETPVAKVPIVPAAILFDLGLGKPAHPGPDEGYRAAAAARAGVVRQGTIGAGTGATVAKLLGRDRVLKGGLGTASLVGPRGIVVGALAVVNCIGSVVDPATARVVAGPRADEPGTFVDVEEAALRRTTEADTVRESTTLICVATNAALAHHQVQRLAYHAHDGLARTIVPAHTFGDGDIAFAVAMGALTVEPQDSMTIGLMAQLAVERAILRGVIYATGLHGVPSAAEWTQD